MTIVKKLLLMTALIFGSDTQLCASEPQQLLEFANSLDRIETEESEPKNIATWIRKIFSKPDKHSTDVTDLLSSITESPKLSLPEKTKAIKQIYIQEITPKENNTGYFSSISTRMKAAAAFVIVASIASYFYFMHPWSTPTAQQ